MPSVTHVFFDIGGVLGTNGWDREQRAIASAKFQLGDEFESRHGEVVGEWEIGRLSFDEYLDFVVFHCPRSFTREEFAGFMLSLSQPFPEPIALARRAAGVGRVALFTLNNESEALNVHRIERFGLRPFFHGFLSSCWLGIRKPTSLIFERALGISQARAEDVLFVDDRERNLVPARAMGFQVHLYTGDGPALSAALTAAGVL